MRTDTPAPRFALAARNSERAARLARTVAAAAGARAGATSKGETVHLTSGKVWCCLPGPRGMRLRCTAGTLWVTQAGEPGDKIVATGNVFVTRTRGKVVVQSEAEASFRLEDGAA